MKAVVVDRQYGHVLLTPPRVEVVPASAIQPAGRQPLFLNSDFGAQTGEMCLGFRISRLGKGIGREFASRYYDSVAACLMVRPAVGSAVSDGLAWMADNSFIIGGWMPLAGESYELKYSGQGFAMGAQDIDIEGAIAGVSRYSTLQQGDIIVGCRSGILFPLCGGSTLEAELNGTPAFSLRIK